MKMRTGWRLLAMFLTCASLFALSWYLFVYERKPQSPEPPKPKTTEELLVGTWRLVNHNGTVLPDDYVVTQEFTADGNHIVRMSYPNLPQLPRKETTGTYRLNRLNITLEHPDPAVTKEIRIEKITEEELWTASGSGDEQEKNYYRKQDK